MHIRLLLITFFLKFFPDLVKKGHVFVLQTPLFRVRARKTKVGKAKMNGIEAELAAREAGTAESDAYSDGKRPRHITLSKDFVTQYCYTEDERQQAIDDLGPEPEITRFKGLGEISPDEFRNFIGPDIRLDQVTLQKSDQVAELLEFYMGDNTMDRQNFIIDNLVIEEDRAEEEIGTEL